MHIHKLTAMVNGMIITELNQVRFIFVTCRTPTKLMALLQGKKKAGVGMAVGQATNDICYKWLPWNQANSNFGMNKSYEAESQTTPGTPKNSSNESTA